jgi:hypothetical protein
VINIYFLFCRSNSVRGLIAYVVNCGRVGKYIVRKSKRYVLGGGGGGGGGVNNWLVSSHHQAEGERFFIFFPPPPPSREFFIAPQKYKSTKERETDHQRKLQVTTTGAETAIDLNECKKKSPQAPSLARATSQHFRPSPPHPPFGKQILRKLLHRFLFIQRQPTTSVSNIAIKSHSTASGEVAKREVMNDTLGRRGDKPDNPTNGRRHNTDEAVGKQTGGNGTKPSSTPAPLFGLRTTKTLSRLPCGHPLPRNKER